MVVGRVAAGFASIGSQEVGTHSAYEPGTATASTRCSTLGGMAAGGHGRGAGIPLKDGVRAGQHPDPAPSSAVAAPQPGRHCWITLPVDAAQPRPGLLEWCRAGHLWEGRVIYAAQLRPGRWASVEEWLPAELLSTE